MNIYSREHLYLCDLWKIYLLLVTIKPFWIYLLSCNTIWWNIQNCKIYRNMRTLITHIFLITTCMVEYYFQFCYKNFANKLSPIHKIKISYPYMFSTWCKVANLWYFKLRKRKIILLWKKIVFRFKKEIDKNILFPFESENFFFLKDRFKFLKWQLCKTIKLKFWKTIILILKIPESGHP